MGNWGDDTDFEVKALKDHEGRFTVNFKKIYYDVDDISEKTLEVTDKHPKDSLMKLWAGTMVGMFIFFMLTYQILALVTLPFLAFYVIGLFRIFKCWKSFKYNAVQFWLMSVGAIAVLFLLSRVLQQLVMKFVL